MDNVHSKNKKIKIYYIILYNIAIKDEFISNSFINNNSYYIN